MLRRVVVRRAAKRHLLFPAILCLLIILFASSGEIQAWHDETHLAVAKAAGYSKWYNAAGADMAKIKAGRVEQNNHYYNNMDSHEITAAEVLAQKGRYNDAADQEGHLYGAILASIEEYGKTARTGKYAEYHLAFCAHYMGDLSQPLHHAPFDDFNKARHERNDGIVGHEVLTNINLIEKHMYPIRLSTERVEEDLAAEIGRVANLSRALALKMKKEDRDMTRDEAYRQLGHSASLLRAVLRHLGKIR